MDTQKATQEYRMNQWIKIIHECCSSGENIASWCRNNGIKKYQIIDVRGLRVK